SAPQSSARRRAALALLGGLLVIFVMTMLLAPAIILVPIAQALIDERPVQPADAVVLTPELTRAGFREAAALWSEGLAGRFLIANAALESPAGMDIADFAM